ncbi:MAG: polyprenyl synthetase family protein [Armatimonadetes bacterium]|jgi:geranylgeranyl pyrophosphate synthase|nr:polyprenyl synthetase family protein [Armatimonadota bacterium]MDI9601586.1 polyprenyl synthetase family protein [Acidobacteriota bacterium]
MATWSLAAHDLVREELDQMQAVLDHLAGSRVPLLARACRHVLDGRGKRIRPTLLSLSARAAAGDDYRPSHDAVLLSAAVETVHVSSLLHDDVVDGASVRRGRVSVNAEWGSPISIFTADYLLAAVFQVLATPENVELLRGLATAVMRMCEAEVLQASSVGNLDVTEDHYREIIDGKTAALMSTACRIGALAASTESSRATRLAEFGRAFGMAFQITDDVLDIAGNAEEVGKPLGSDIRAGYFTLPIIALRNGADEATAAELRALLGRGTRISDDVVAEIAASVRASGALEYCQRVAGTYVDEALDHLSALPDSEARQALEALCRGLLDRHS